MKVKITKENLEQACKNAISYREVAESLGLNEDGGGNIARIKSKIQEYSIDVSHFKGQGHGKVAGTRKISIEEYTTNQKSIKTYILKIRLLEEGIFQPICNRCGNTEWLGNPIPLELHHKDGNKRNNDISNLELLCPNCHYFTDTYKSKNRINHGKPVGNYNFSVPDFSSVSSIPKGTLQHLAIKKEDIVEYIINRNGSFRPVIFY